MPKAYVLTGPRTLEYREYALAPLGPRDVRLTGVVSGISHGTELNLWRGTAPFQEKSFDGQHRLFLPREAKEAEEPQPASAPRGRRLGYELVSRVAEVGTEVREVSVGDLVHSATAHQPETVINMDANARAAIPMQRLPEGVSPEEAVFSALVGVALAASHDALIKVGDHVAVFGMGAIGLIAVQLARLSGALRVTAIDPLANRRQAALTLGADEALDPTVEDPAVRLKVQEAGGGPDVVIEASGTYPALQSALRTAHMAGTVVTLGYYQGGAAPLLLGEEWHHNRLTMISSMAVWDCPSRFYPMWDRPRISRTAMDLLARGLVRVGDLVTHRVPYDRAPEAYRLIDEHPEEAIKVVLTY